MAGRRAWSHYGNLLVIVSLLQCGLLASSVSKITKGIDVNFWLTFSPVIVSGIAFLVFLFRATHKIYERAINSEKPNNENLPEVEQPKPAVFVLFVIILIVCGGLTVTIISYQKTQIEKLKRQLSSSKPIETDTQISHPIPISLTVTNVTVTQASPKNGALAKIDQDLQSVNTGARHDLLINFTVTNDFSIDQFNVTASVVRGNAKISNFDLEADPSQGNPKYSSDNKTCSLSCFPLNRAAGLLYISMSAVPCEVSLTSPLWDGQLMLDFYPTNTALVHMKR